MTGRCILPLTRPSDVRQAHDMIDRAHKAGGWTMELRKEKRTDDQNRRMWAMLNEVAKARPEINGIRMTAEDWKCVFMHALDRELRMVPALDGQGFVPLGYRSSKLSKKRMSDLIEVIQAYAAREGIELSDPTQAAA